MMPFTALIDCISSSAAGHKPALINLNLPVTDIVHRNNVNQFFATGTVISEWHCGLFKVIPRSAPMRPEWASLLLDLSTGIPLLKPK